MDRSVRALPGVGPKRAELLEKLGIKTVGDALNYFPRAYEDRSKIVPIEALVEGEFMCIRATVASRPVTRYTSGGRQLTRFIAADDTGTVSMTYFNNKYLNVAQGETYCFYGKAELAGRQFCMTNPQVEKDGRFELMGGILPIYHLTAGLNNTSVLRITRSALPYAEEIPDTLPVELREKYGFSTLADAYHQLHEPKNMEDVNAARKRFAFEELFCMSIGLTVMKQGRGEAGEKLPVPDMQPFYDAIPFALTGAQKRSIDEAIHDMTAGKLAMRRMVQGDVGSGKTMVAAACAYAAAVSGAQTAMMAPTEILAAQHYNDLSHLLEPLGIRTGLLSAGMSVGDRRAVMEGLESGEILFVVGTHALISEKVKFADLKLVITDEQHRFGVRQRTLLKEKAHGTAHMLVMSATPIPRTLAMVLYGDMDLSVIDELPPGRIPVDTRAPAEDKRDSVYGFMRRQLLKGRQAYVVCPMIDENGDEDLKSAELFAEEVRAKYFPDMRVELLHGRMPNHRKDEIMQAFAAGEIKLLVATTVIEVGVNVPNATMIVIENAERFGLSQLHQLRGRVGRAQHKSYCVLMSKSHTGTTRARLDIMCKTNDGFEIAREDLRLRGPGEFFGERQSGIPGLRVADLGADMELLNLAHREAQLLLEQDPEFSEPGHEGIRKQLEKLFSVE